MQVSQIPESLSASIWFIILKQSSNFWSIAWGIWLLRSLGQWACSHLALRILKWDLKMDLDGGAECELGQEDEQRCLGWVSLTPGSLEIIIKVPFWKCYTNSPSSVYISILPVLRNPVVKKTLYLNACHIDLTTQNYIFLSNNYQYSTGY